MHRPASSTLDILMNPKPRERSDYVWLEYTLELAWMGMTYPLVVNYNDLFNTPKPAELVVQVSFSRTDTQAKHPQHVGGIGRLLRGVSTR